MLPVSRKDQREPRTCSNAGGVNYSPADVPSFSPRPPSYQLYCLGAYSLSPPFPSPALYTYTPPSTSSSLLQQPLTKTSSPLLIPPLFKTGRPRELVDKVHTSRELLFYSLNSSVMKILPSTLCLSWHPITSLYQASSLSHLLNIQLSFKSTPRCSSFVFVYLRCCSMFMECSFTGKIPWPKPSKGTTHLGPIFHDTCKALTFWEHWFPQSEHKTSLKYLKLSN